MIGCVLMTALRVLSPATLTADEREPVAAAIVPAVGHRVSDERAAAILATAENAFHTWTMLAIDSSLRLPPQAIDRCRAAGGFLCWALALRDLVQTGGAPPRLFLLLSIAPDESGRDRLSAVLLDVARALAIHDGAARSTADWRETVEDTIFVEAIVAESAFREAADSDETRVYFGKLINQDLRAALEKSGRWSPPGTIRVIAEQQRIAGGERSVALGATLRLDDAAVPAVGEIDAETLRKLGVVAEPVTTIVDVRRGDRVLGVTKPDCVPATARIRVRAKEETEVRVLISCPPLVAPVAVEDEPGLWSSPWLYAGAAVAALVAGGIAVAVTLPEERKVYQLHF